MIILVIALLIGWHALKRLFALVVLKSRCKLPWKRWKGKLTPRLACINRRKAMLSPKTQVRRPLTKNIVLGRATKSAPK